MLTSARIRSGLASRARESASFPSETTVRVTSSPLKVISMAFWMVTESSARSRDLGTGERPPDGYRTGSIPPVPRPRAGRQAFGIPAERSHLECTPRWAALSKTRRCPLGAAAGGGWQTPEIGFVVKRRRASLRHRLALPVRPVHRHANPGSARDVVRGARDEEHAIGRQPQRIQRGLVRAGIDLVR